MARTGVLKVPLTGLKLGGCSSLNFFMIMVLPIPLSP